MTAGAQLDTRKTLTAGAQLDAWKAGAAGDVERYYNISCTDTETVRIQLTDFSHPRNPRAREYWGIGTTLDTAIVDGLDTWQTNTGENTSV